MSQEVWEDDVDFATLKGETITKISGCNPCSEQIHFETASGRHFLMAHHPDCCESVEVEQVDGDPQDLIGHEITLAEVTSGTPEGEYYGDKKWTFYRLGCMGGYLTIRWLGESNGYYSIEVSFDELKSH